MAKWIWFAGAAFALTSCGHKEKATEALAVLPAGETLTLAATEIADMKAVGAEITTRDSADARARISGTLASLTVRAGDMVEKGQRIGTIVDSRLGFEASANSAQVAAAQAEAARTHGDLARIQYLYNHQVYAKARLDSAVAGARAADAHVAAARAQQAASASVVGQGAILAPASGRVLRADIPSGSVVSPGMSVATITAGPPVMRLDLPESLARSVRVGARVLVAESDLPVGSREGSVTQVYPAVTGGRVRVDAAVPGLVTDLVGRRVSVSVEAGRRRTLLVPQRFISTRYGIDQVNIVTPDHRLSAVPVQVAPTAEPGKVEILSGVSAGDTLFAAGWHK
jgi:RND family efflux transporter MFP subunit